MMAAPSTLCIAPMRVIADWMWNVYTKNSFGLLRPKEFE